MIVLKNIDIEYRPDSWTAPRVRILAGANVVIPSNSHVAVLGGASSGKTSLLKVLCGSLPPSHGVVHRRGTVSFPVGFVGSSGRVSVGQYIQFVAKCYCVEPKAFLRFVIEFAELEDLLSRPTGKLEPDLRSRMNMTIGYALPFDHYLLDSRLAVSDPAFRKKCMRLFEARRRTSGTVLATRRASVAREFCTSGIVLHEARLVYFEDVDRAIAYYEAIEPNPLARSNDVYYAPTSTESFFEMTEDSNA